VIEQAHGGVLVDVLREASRRGSTLRSAPGAAEA
jgi:hypothetical protein